MISYLPFALTWLGGAFQQAFCPESHTISTGIYETRIGPGPRIPNFGFCGHFPPQTVPEQGFRAYNLSLQHGSDSDAGVFTQSHTKEWGEETATIRLPGPASSIAVNDNETLLAVGYQTNVIVYELPSRKHLQTVRELGRVSSVKFQPRHNRLLVQSMVLRVNQSIGYSQTQFVTTLLDLDHELTKPFTGIDGFPPVVSRTASAAIEGILKEVEEKPQWELERLRSVLQNALLTLALESELYSSPRFWQEDWTYGRTHATFSSDGSFLVYLAPKTVEIIAGSPPFRSQFQLDLEPMWTLPSPDSRLIASYHHEGTHKFSLRNVTNGAPVHTRKFSLWNATNGAPVHTFNITSFPNTIVFSPDSQLVAASCHDIRICVWRTESGELDRTLDVPRYSEMLAISPDGKYLALRQSDGFQLVDFQAGQAKLSWQQPRAPSSFLDPHRSILPGGCVKSDYERMTYMRQLQFNKHGILFWRLESGAVLAYDMVRNVKWQFNAPDDKYSEVDIVLTENGFIGADIDGVIRFWTLA